MFPHILLPLLLLVPALVPILPRYPPKFSPVKSFFPPCCLSPHLIMSFLVIIYLPLSIFFPFHFIPFPSHTVCPSHFSTPSPCSLSRLRRRCWRVISGASRSLISSLRNWPLQGIKITFRSRSTKIRYFMTKSSGTHQGHLFHSNSQGILKENDCS